MGVPGGRDLFMREILGQPDALRRAAGAVRDQRGPLAELVRAREGRTIVLTGMGSSLDACYPTVSALGGDGVLAVMLDASELLHFHIPALGAGILLVAVSQSGESAEVVKLAERLDGRERPFVVSVTNGTENRLARTSDVALDTRAGPEAAPSTMTFAASLVALAAVTRVLAGRDAEEVVERTAHEAEEAAGLADSLLRGSEERASTLRDWLGDRQTLVVLGRGSARAAAEMGALVLKEAARFPAESLGSADFRHGPLELAGPGLATMLIATEPTTRELDFRLAGDLLSAGGTVLVVGEPEGLPPGAVGFEVPSLDRLIAPALAVVPAQLLAWRLALDRGFRPAEFILASKTTTWE